MKSFDLNIEEILDNWEIHHAIREIIANALDEKLLSNTKNIVIEKNEDKSWNIQDFGRGLQYEHLTQNENIEKLNHPNSIGKFGVGLKDALATFNRHKIEVIIKSKYCDLTFGMSPKINFDNVVTLHAFVNPPSLPTIEGTSFILKNCNDIHIEQSKSFFLIFSNESIIETTKYGDVLNKTGNLSNIYVNGVKVSTEENFLFSYNITSVNKKIKDALNRERTNVGRSAYAERIKLILLECNELIVAEKLVNDLQEYGTGNIHDELQWTDVSTHATKLLNSSKKVVFFTPEELQSNNNYIDRAKSDGYEVVTISEKIKSKIVGETDYNNKPIIDLHEYVDEWSDSFKFIFIDVTKLNQNEKEIFNLTSDIFQLIGGKPSNVKDIKISETMRPNSYNYSDAAGLWDGTNIIIKRSELADIESYASTLLHETAHAISGESDISIGFEESLTNLLGKLYSNSLKISKSSNYSQQPVSSPPYVKPTSHLTNTNYTQINSKKNFPHGIHIFLSLMFAGFWIPFWFLIYQARNKNIYK